MSEIFKNLFLILFFLALSVREAIALPICTDSPKRGTITTVSNWNNCDGFLTLPNGDTYEGAWKSGRFHGIGIFNYNAMGSAKGNKYIGNHENGLRHGKGKYIFSNGTMYEGDYKNGMVTGFGVYLYANGQIYEGEFLNEQYHGKGKLTFKNGDIFKGDYVDGRPHGKGTYSHVDGSKYVGDYKNGAVNGNGTYTYPNGTNYTGEFLNGKWHGQGKFTYADGGYYKGAFSHGNLHGFGTTFYPDGAIHEGEYLNGKRHGSGKLTTPDGAVGIYVWNNGVREDRNVVASKGTEDFNQHRVALVVGNGSYQSSMGPLKNPPNDAKLVSQTLRELGFEVIELIDANQKQMKKAAREFSSRLSNNAEKNAVGVFYYAGHGIQVNGNNYLIPLEAEITSEGDVDIEAVSANSILMAMESARANYNFIILDACRNNPIPRSSRSSTRGLARMTTSMGSLIAYSTSPGSVALDGDGSNSPYTLALVEALKEKLPVERMFREVRTKVIRATNKKQTPWESSSLIGEDFYFSKK